MTSAEQMVEELEAPPAEVPPEAMRAFIQRIATGPEMSKDLTRDEARDGMRLILQDRVDPVQMGIFLIALRMKRETDAENLGVLDALVETTRTAAAPVPEVVTLSDPFNGYNRILPASPFLPAVLAACGVPTVSQGVESVGPKFGITHHRVLKAAGKSVDLEPAEAAARLDGAGWAYVDQRHYAPDLHRLVELRRMMVKRSAVTTAEVIPSCVRGERHNHLLTGYVHRPYPRIYALLAQAAGYHRCVLVRGVEGGVVPSLRQRATAYLFEGEDREGRALDTDPAAIGIRQDVRAVALPPGLEDGHFDAERAAVVAAEMGLEALRGAGGPVADSLVYGAAIALHALGRVETLAGGAEAARRALTSGEARARFEA